MRREIDGNKIRAGVETTPQGGKPDPVMTTGHGRGPTLIHGRAMNADKITGPRERKGDKPVSNTMSGNLGRERFDREIIGERPKAHRSASQRNNWRKKQRRLDAKNA